MECWRPLKITNISAEDLKKHKRFLLKMKVYVVVSVTGDPFINPKEEFKTPVANEGENNPSWDTHLNFILHETSIQNNHLQLIFRFHCDRPIGDGYVGEARVPVKDLFDRATYPNGSQLVYYPVIRRSGREQGCVKFSFTFGEVFASADAPSAALHTQSPSKFHPPRPLPSPPLSPQQMQLQQQVVVPEMSPLQLYGNLEKEKHQQYPSKGLYVYSDAKPYQAHSTVGSQQQSLLTSDHMCKHGHGNTIEPSYQAKVGDNELNQYPMNDNNSFSFDCTNEPVYNQANSMVGDVQFWPSCPPNQDSGSYQNPSRPSGRQLNME